MNPDNNGTFRGGNEDPHRNQKKPMRKGGKPRRIIPDINHAALVTRLARIGCTWEEIGGTLEIPDSVAQTRYMVQYKKGRKNFHRSIRRRQYQIMRSGVAGSTTMAIWLGKNELRQKDIERKELTGAGGGPLEITNFLEMPQQEFDRKALSMEKAFTYLEETGS